MNDNIQIIKDRISIYDYLNKDNIISKIGNETFRAEQCPFCGHKGCFTIYENTKTWKCFSCKDGGDIIDLVIKKENLDFPAALTKLSKEAGIHLKTSKEAIKHYESIEKRKKIYEFAMQYYKSKINNHKAITYLKEIRKRDDKTIGKAKYGFTGSNPLLHKKLLDKGFTEDEIITSGLVRRKDEKIYDFFGKNLFIYPVYHNNVVVDFFSKDYFQKDKGKRRDYQLPRQYKLDNSMFYGIDAFYHKKFILVEGPEDRLSILQISTEIPVVAIRGSFSEDQLSYIEKYGKDKVIFLGFDPDAAGEKYEKAILDRLAGESTLLKMVWNYSLGDIDDYLRGKSKKDLQEVIDLSQDPIAYYTNNLPDTSSMHSKIAEAYWMPIVKWIALNNSSITRMGYIERLAEKMGGKSRWIAPVRAAVRNLRDNDEDETDLTDIPNIGKEKWGIISSNNRYYHVEEDKNKLISRFVIKILRYIEQDEEIFYECLLINELGIQSRPLLFDSKSRVNVRNFRELCGKVGSYYFLGKDNDLPDVWSYEEKRAKISKRSLYYQRYGYIPEHKMWLFDNCAIIDGKIYKKNDDGYIETSNFDFKTYGVNIYSGDKPTINYEFKMTEKLIKDIIEHFFIMLDDNLSGLPSYNGFLLLGYVYAVAYLEELLKDDKKFPFLMLYGASGTGKTEVIQLLMNIFGFHNAGENWGESSPPGISMAIEELSSLPYWQEEYKNALGYNKRQQKKVELVNNVYNRTSSGKGGLDHRQIKEVNATLIFSGQDRPEDKAFLSRSIVMGKNTPTQAATACFYWLSAMRENLSSLFFYIIKHKTAQKKKQIIKYEKELYNYIKRRTTELNPDIFVDDRSVLNYCKIGAGWLMFEYPNYKEEFKEWLATEIIKDVTRKTQEDILVRFFEDVDNIFEDIGEVAMLQDAFLYLRYSKIYHEWKKNGVRMGIPEYLSKNALLDYIKNDTNDYYVGETRIYIQGKQRRMLQLEYSKLPKSIRQITETWRNE